MSEPASVIPKSEAGDAEDVSTALETASLLWAKGDAPESIRWIRRAAEAAGEAGNDMRALALARAAADLTSAEPARKASKPPPLPVDPGVVTSAPAIGGVGPAVAPTSGASSVASFSVAARSISTRPGAAVPRAGNAAATHEPAPAPRKSAPLNAPPPPSARAQPREAEPVQRPSGSSMPAVNASVNPLVSKALAAGEQEEAAPKSARLSVPPSAHPSVTAAARKVSTSTAPAAPRGRQALRVAVRPSSDEKGLLLVRVLEEGHAVPSDAHEALLVGLELGATITSRKG